MLRGLGAGGVFIPGITREALDLFDRALAEHPNQPWPLRLAQMQVQARLGTVGGV